MADSNYVENSQIIKTSDLGDDALIPVQVARRQAGGSWFDFETQYMVAKNSITPSGSLSITPVVTAGSGSVDDFNIDYMIVGGKVFMNFLCREFIVVTGEATTTVTIDLTGTALEPASNFSGGFAYKGGMQVGAFTSAGDTVQEAAINTVSGEKKLQVTVTLTANATGDFNTLVSGSISFDL